MNKILRCFRFFALATGLVEALACTAGAQTLTVSVVNQSNKPVTFSPQLILVSSATDGTAALNSGTTPITVPASGSNSQVTVSLNPNPGGVTATLQINGTYAGTPFVFIQNFYVASPGQGIAIPPDGLNTTRPFTTPSVFTSSGSNGTITVTLPANPVSLPETTWSVKGTVVQRDGKNFFAKGVAYSPTPIGGATYTPGVGDWFAPPWWRYDGINNVTDDIGYRDTQILSGIGVNSIRTYYTWFWSKKNDLTYLGGLNQNSPLPVFSGSNVQYPYTVYFDHTPFLDACYRSGISVILGIAMEGADCFNFATPQVMQAYQNFYLQTAQKIATLYGNHPAVMGFCMSNEQNQSGWNTDSRCWLYYQQMYNAIKVAAPNKLVTIAFQDDQTLYNGTLKVTDQAGQNPPTPFNNLPIEQAISKVVDVWGLNIYAGISGDFPIFEKNVIKAKNGAYKRPLWITEWGTPSGGSDPAGAVGPPEGSARSTELSAQALAKGAVSISAAIGYMQANLSFVAGGHYFEYTNEWWKNDSLDPKDVDTSVSPLNPATGKYETNAQGEITLLGGEKVFPAYPFVHDGSDSPAWPDEGWGLYEVAVSNGRDARFADPKNPDALTPTTPYVTALQAGYSTLAAAYAKQSPSSLDDKRDTQQAARQLGLEKTAWGLAYPISPQMAHRQGLDEKTRLWHLDPFGLVKILEDDPKGLTARLLEWGNEKAFLPKDRPDRIYFFSTDEWRYVVEDYNVVPPNRLRGFSLIPPPDAQWSAPEGTYEQVPIPSVSVPGR